MMETYVSRWLIRQAHSYTTNRKTRPRCDKSSMFWRGMCGKILEC